MGIELDVVVLIAIKEEFDYISETFNLKPSTEIISDLGCWYEWKFINDNKIPKKVYFSFIGQMGPASAIKYTTKFLEHYRPKILINIGVAGAIDKDVNLGDIVIPDLTDLYEDSGSIEEINGIPFLKPSGKPIITSDFKKHVDNFEYKNRDRYSQWIYNCEKEYNFLIESIKDEKLQSFLNFPVKIHSGHIACGSVVVKSKIWKNTLLSKDRKYLAVDMESAAIAFSAIDDSGNHSSKLLIIRVISDKADENKEVLDNLFGNKNAIRKWAILNGLSFLREILPTIADANDKQQNTQSEYINYDKNRLGSLVPEVVKVFKQKGIESLKFYDSFFSFFHDKPDKSSLFQYIIDKVESKEQSQHNVATIVGYTGTGKSAILSCLYLYQLNNFKLKLSKFKPIYLNLRNFLSEYSGSEKRIEETFEQELIDILNNINTNVNQGTIFIIDGFDEYQRHPYQSHIDQKLFKFFNDLSQKNIIKVVGVGSNEETFIEERKSDMLSWASKDTLINLNRVLTDSKNLKDILMAYVKLEYTNDFEQICEQLKKIINDFKINEIDIFTLSILDMAVRQKWDSKSRGIGTLYHMYCRERIRYYSKNITISNDDSDKEVSKLSKYVFDYYIRRLNYSSNKIYVNFPHEHTTIKEFLVAEYLVHSIIDQNIDDNNLLNYIYPYGINRFVKSIINRNTDFQTKVFKSIQDLYLKTQSRQKVHLCYIAGRFTERNIRIESSNVLKRWLKDLKNDPRKQKKIDENEFREWLLHQRTIYISLIYMDDVKSAHDYLKLLLNNSQWDDLNRGFHLEYYEDFQQSVSQYRMISFDDINVRPKKTFEILFNKLKNQCEANKSYARSLVELHTLSSLCVHRHIVGKLSDDKRIKIRSLIKKVLYKNKISVPSFYRSYLEMSLNIMGRKNVSPGSLLSEIYTLKTIPRAGWNAERTLPGNRTIKRHCPYPESIAEHIFGCLILAETLLPETIPEESTYSKNEVLRILLIHDLAETYVGDKVSFNKTEKDIQSENRAMNRIMATGGIDVFPGIKSWRKRWDVFQRQNNINGKLAKDFDLIECYVQLVNYYNIHKCSIPDAEQWVKDDIYDELSEIGKSIFEKLRHSDSDILNWYRE